MNKLARELVAILSFADDCFDEESSSEAFIATIEAFAIIIDKHGDEPVRKFLPYVSMAAKRIHRNVIEMGKINDPPGPADDAITLICDCRGVIDKMNKLVGRG